MLPHLEQLQLTAAAGADYDRQLSPKTLQAVYNAPYLRDLALVNWNVQASHIQAMQACIKRNSNLQKLFLVGCQWNPDIVHALAFYIQQQSTLQEFYLSFQHQADKKPCKGCAASRTSTTTISDNTSLWTVLVRSLAHTKLTHVGLATIGSDNNSLQSVPIETWRHLWEHNYILQQLMAPGLTANVQQENDFWLQLNRAGGNFLSMTDQMHLNVLIRVLSHQDIVTSV